MRRPPDIDFTRHTWYKGNLENSACPRQWRFYILALILRKYILRQANLVKQIIRECKKFRRNTLLMKYLKYQTTKNVLKMHSFQLMSIFSPLSFVSSMSFYIAVPWLPFMPSTLRTPSSCSQYASNSSMLQQAITRPTLPSFLELPLP